MSNNAMVLNTIVVHFFSYVIWSSIHLLEWFDCSSWFSHSHLVFSIQCGHYFGLLLWQRLNGMYPFVRNSERERVVCVVSIKVYGLLNKWNYACAVIVLPFWLCAIRHRFSQSYPFSFAFLHATTNRRIFALFSLSLCLSSQISYLLLFFLFLCILFFFHP